MKSELQTEIEQYLIERGWNNNSPENIAKSISIEAAELLENWQWNNKAKEEILVDSNLFQNIQDELGDIMIYCIEMASVLDLDFEKIVKNKLSKVKLKYSIAALKENNGDTLKIKSEFRERNHHIN